MLLCYGGGCTSGWDLPPGRRGEGVRSAATGWGRAVGVKETHGGQGTRMPSHVA